MITNEIENIKDKITKLNRKKNYYDLNGCDNNLDYFYLLYVIENYKDKLKQIN
tara:strand:+ start:79 stop:237 length:159 start_codon:yes stop_codon:yes gene_type:complete